MKRSGYFSVATVSSDLVAGLTNALVYIPQGIAYALVAGVSPVHGLYTGIIAPVVGALTTGSSFMVIIATNELAIPTGSIIAAFGADFSVHMLFTLTLLMGLCQLVLGLLKLGNVTRFVSESVMTGFFSGVAVLLILTQLDKLTGYKSNGSNALVKFMDWLTHPHHFDLSTTSIGVITIGVILLFQRSRLHTFAFILAVISAAVVAAVLNQPSVTLLGGVSEIPSSLPSFVLPDFTLVPQLLLPAISLAIVGLAVAAGVSQSYPEPDGSIPNASRDFIGQGTANLVGGFFQTMPAGGSFSRTATNVSAGATSRIANVLLGVLLALLLMTVGGLVKYLPMAALAGLLIVIGAQALKFERIARVRHTHISERVAMIVTFVLTLLINLEYAIFAGVLLTLGLYIYSSSTKIRIVEIVPMADGRYSEQPAPREMPSHKTTMLHVYGNAFFAAVYTIEENLPSIDKTKNAAVIFSMRGHDAVTTTLLAFLERYAKKLQAGGNRLILAGVEPGVKEQLEATGTMALIGAENVFDTTAVLGEALEKALTQANQWTAATTQREEGYT
jgi:SulP family sulfate permease